MATRAAQHAGRRTTVEQGRTRRIGRDVWSPHIREREGEVRKYALGRRGEATARAAQSGTHLRAEVRAHWAGWQWRKVEIAAVGTVLLGEVVVLFFECIEHRAQQLVGVLLSIANEGVAATAQRALQQSEPLLSEPTAERLHELVQASRHEASAFNHRALACCLALAANALREGWLSQRHMCQLLLVSAEAGCE